MANVVRSRASSLPTTESVVSSAMKAHKSAISSPVKEDLPGPAAYLNLGGSSYDQMIKMLQQIQSSNNAWSAQQASLQRDWQVAQNQKAMDFNASEAAKNRSWQEYMSNSAHQREVRDLMAAGLNPVLSAMNGNGAAVTSGATASGVTSAGSKGDTDTSLSGAIASIFGTVLQAQTELQKMNTNALTNLAVADKYNAMSKYATDVGSSTQLTHANIQAAASRYAADASAAASRYGSDRHYDASKVAASISAAAARYGYDVNSMTQRDIAAFNAQVNKDLAEMGYQHDFDVRTAFPSTELGALSSLIGQATGGTGISSALDSLNRFFGGDGRGSGFSSGSSWSGSGFGSR